MTATSADLELARNLGDIRESLRVFNAWTDHELLLSLMRQTTYWVMDPESGEFGPSKAVGFKPLTPAQYRSAREGNYSGATFDGGVTHRHIQSVLRRPYAPNGKLTRRLREWCLALGGAEALKNVDVSKWQFLELPTGDPATTDWWDAEVSATIADYFAMLDAELAGKTYSKAEHRRSLLKQLNGRSAAAVEFKHGNISAVLNELGLPYILGI